MGSRPMAPMAAPRLMIIVVFFLLKVCSPHERLQRQSRQAAPPPHTSGVAVRGATADHDRQPSIRE